MYYYLEGLKKSLNINTCDDVVDLMQDSDKNKNYDSILKLYANLGTTNKLWADSISKTALKISSTTDNLASKILFSSMARSYALDNSTADKAKKLETEAHSAFIEQSNDDLTSKDKHFIAAVALSELNYVRNVYITNSISNGENFRQPVRELEDLVSGTTKCLIHTNLLHYSADDKDAVVEKYSEDDAALSLSQVDSKNILNDFSQNKNIFGNIFQKLFSKNELKNNR